MGIIIRQSFKATIVNYIGMLLGAFNIVILFPLVLTSSQIGLIRVLFDCALALGVFAQLGVIESMIKFFPVFKNSDKKHNGFFFFSMAQSLIGFLITSILVIVFRDEIMTRYASNAPMFVAYFDWIFPLTFFTMFLIYFETVASLVNRIVVPKLIREVIVRLLVIVSLILFYFELVDFYNLVVIQVGIYFIALLINFFYARRLIGISIKPDYGILNKSLKREVGSFTVYRIAGSFSGIIVTTIVTLMLGAQEGLASTGIWSISLFVALFIDSPHRAIVSIATPILADALSKNNFEKVKDIARRTSSVQFLISSLIYLLVVANIENLFAVMPNGAEFKAGASVIILVGASKLVEMISGLNSPLIGYKYFRFSVPFSIVVAIVSIISNFYFIPRYSIMGAGIATLLTAVIVHSIMHAFLAWRFNFTPLTKGILYTLILLVSLFGVNWLIPQMGHPVIDAAFRCLILSSIYIVVAYRIKIDSEVNEQIDGLLKFGLDRLKK